LLKNIRAETSNRRREIGEVRFPIFVESGLQMMRKNVGEDVLHPFACRHGRFDGNELAIEAKNDRPADLEMNVRSAAVNGGLQNPMKDFHGPRLTIRGASG